MQQPSKNFFVRPAIIVVAFNRAGCLKRLLQSLQNADYSGYSNINLIISIDAGGNDETGNIADDLQWNYGEKRIIKHEKNKGLRDHIISCADLTSEYESVIILEDDCFVSRHFYDYACQSLTFYEDDSNIAGISLYTYQTNEYAELPIMTLKDNYAAFFVQVPSSWGQIFTKQQWSNFKLFYATNPAITKNDKIPEQVKKWPETSWKKYFYKYIVEKNLYFIYPAISLVTNFADAGTHFGYDTSVYQVALETRYHPLNYSFVDFKNGLNKYDAYFEILPQCLLHYGALMPEGTGMDLYGTRQLTLFDYEYVYSIKDCSEPIRSYGLVMVPFFQNIIYDIAGNNIFFGKKGDFTTVSENNKSLIIQKFESTGFKLGIEQASKSNDSMVLHSTPYKLGYYLMHPLIFIKKIFAKIPG
jgi:glycosyltransferase involved in cell wall biosynthesis